MPSTIRRIEVLSYKNKESTQYQYDLNRVESSYKIDGFNFKDTSVLISHSQSNQQITIFLEDWPNLRFAIDTLFKGIPE